MKISLFETLARSQIVREYETSFPTATGFVLKILPANPGTEVSPFGVQAHPFCDLMSRSPHSAEYCSRTFLDIQRKAAGNLSPRLSCCFAGMAHIAIPVVAAGEHVCTLYGGQLLLENPTQQRFTKVTRQLVRFGLEDHLPALERAWFHTPVISDKQLQAIMYLLHTFAGRLSRYAAACILEPADGEPAAVMRARKFIKSHSAEPITMPDAACHVQLSKSRFCKLFKNTVGVTFTQYLALVRVKKAKSLLASPHRRIRDIASETGFDSLSQFNRVFRQCTEMSPTQYRASLEGAAPPVSKQRAFAGNGAEI